MQADLVVNEKLVIPGWELSISASRSSGPGGQHVNKTSSRVSLRWNVLESTALSAHEQAKIMRRLKSHIVGEGEILIHVESERSQHRNKELARERLASLLREALRPIKRRIATKPTSGSKEKRLEGKKKRGIIKTLRKSDIDDK